jgi:hypothetical protein
LIGGIASGPLDWLVLGGFARASALHSPCVVSTCRSARSTRSAMPLTRVLCCIRVATPIRASRSVRGVLSIRCPSSIRDRPCILVPHCFTENVWAEVCVHRVRHPPGYSTVRVFQLMIATWCFGCSGAALLVQGLPWIALIPRSSIIFLFPIVQRVT